MRTINVTCHETCPWLLTSSEYFICLETPWYTQATTLKPEKAELMKVCMHCAFIIPPLLWLCIHEGCERVYCIVCRVNLICLSLLLFLQHMYDWELPEDVPQTKRAFAARQHCSKHFHGILLQSHDLYGFSKAAMRSLLLSR